NDLEAFVTSAKAAHTEATHEQSKAENKYDTRGLEASYLAHGQSRQAAELEQAKREFESLVLNDSDAEAPIDSGTLLKLAGPEGTSFYFVGPRAGGLEIVFEGSPIVVITPNSPLGRELIRKSR